MKSREEFIRAFTLIELLVVVAIIALLSSVVLASLSSARMKARDVRRITFARSIQQALAMYEADGGRPTTINAGQNCDGVGNVNIAGGSCPSILTRLNQLGYVSKSVLSDSIYGTNAYYVGVDSSSSTWQVYAKLENPTSGQSTSTLSALPGGGGAVSNQFNYAVGFAGEKTGISAGGGNVVSGGPLFATLAAVYPHGALIGVYCAPSKSTGYIVCAGGREAGGVTRPGFARFNPATGAFLATSAAFAVPMYNTSCAESRVDNHIYCFGGIEYFSNTQYATISKYNPATDVLTTAGLGVLPRTLQSTSCAEGPGTSFIYCFGGYNTFYSSSASSDIVEFNVIAGTSSILASPKISGAWAMNCVSNYTTNKINCVGGYNGSAPMAAHIEFDPIAKTINSRSLPDAAVYAPGCSYSETTGNILCVGGAGSGGHVNTIYKYETGTNSMTRVSTTTPHVRASPCHRDPASENIYCIAGSASGAATSAVLKFTP